MVGGFIFGQHGNREVRFAFGLVLDELDRQEQSSTAASSGSVVGKRFLVSVPPLQEVLAPIVVDLNWEAGLKR